MTRSRLAAILAATCLSALVGASPALAGQIVWKQGDSIWAMDDNGANQRPLISLAQTPEVTFIGAPHVHPLGGQAIVFHGSTTAYTTQLGSRAYGGNNATGVYYWQSGVAARMSGPPSTCTTGTTACTTWSRDPELAADGSYVFGAGAIAGDANSSDFSYSLRRGLADGSSSEFPTQCSNANSNVSEGAEEPSPNPVNAAELAYIGCSPADVNFDFGLWIKNGAGAPVEIAQSTVRLYDPSWKLNGSGVLVAAAGLGIFLVPRDGSDGPQVFSGEASSPRDLGDRILFESGFDLYTIPSNCVNCTLADATKLTTGADSEDPAWTSAASFPAPAPGPGPGTGGGDTGGGNGAGGGAATDTSAPSLRSSFSRRLRLRSVFSRGLSFNLALGEAARVQTTVSVDGRTVRRYRLLTGRRARRARSLAIGRTTRSLEAGRGSVRVKVARKYARKLRGARSLSLKVTITATDAAGNKRTSRKTLKLKR